MAQNIIPEVVNLSNNQDIDGILWGWRWGNGTPQNLTFSFPTGTAEYTGYQSITTFEVFNAAQQTAVRRILTNVASFSNLAFTETTNTGATLRHAAADSINYTNDNNVAGHTGDHTINTAEANPPELANGAAPYSPTYSQGDSWYNRTGYDNPNLGSFQYATVMHETGHNLGLKHGHVTQNGHGITFPILPAAHDSFEYSVMTYRQFPGDDPTNGVNASNNPTTFMQNDIAALQYMYGANYGPTANNGDTTYTWSPTTGEEFINGSGQGAPNNNFVLMTQWDGGGNDTYDFSNYSTNLSVDLNPGEWIILDTSANQLQRANLGNNGAGGANYFARGNIANALVDPNNPTETVSFIENAKGGSGNDTFKGNKVNNTFTGGAGDDTIDGGAGDDTVVYSGFRSQYATSENSGVFTIAELGSGLSDGIDKVSNVEFFKFSNRTYNRTEVLNQAPTIDNITFNSRVINENETVTLTGSFTDEASDNHKVTIKWGDANDSGDTVFTLNSGAGVNTFTATHKYKDDGSAGTLAPGANFTAFDFSTITVTVADQLQNSTTKILSNAVRVDNVDPVIISPSNNLPSTGVIVQGDRVEFKAQYSDLGLLDYHNIAYNWGDGSSIDSSDQNPLNGSTGHTTGSHVYNKYGTFTANLSVKDDDLGTASTNQTVKVARKVILDWKPGSNPSAMSFVSGKIPVAILGNNGGTTNDISDDFNVRSIDVASIRFDDQKDVLLNGGGINGIGLKGNGEFQVSYKDINGDGIEDLVAQVDAKTLGTVVNSNSIPFLADRQIYAFGGYGGSNSFFGTQQIGDPIKIV